ncbi:MAG: hypothetical protein OEZ16_07675 [Chromatiales bacterium]|nr:hypothetical protein [Chromatiales bacterium]
MNTTKRILLMASVLYIAYGLPPAMADDSGLSWQATQYVANDGTVTDERAEEEVKSEDCD